MGGMEDKMRNKPDKIKITEIFNNRKYLIPIYQRNYAWTVVEIEQLLDDIGSLKLEKNDEAKSDKPKEYFLGNLIVNERNNIYEVIDGQQRLTTLFLLHKYLENKIPEDSLQFEARKKSNEILHNLTNDSFSSEDEKGNEIVDGFKIIENYFYFKNQNKKDENEENFKAAFKAKLKNTFLVQIQVPENTDLNHYFEIMNTRGEQLEAHEIVKGKILGALNNEDRKIAALIWESCSDMDSYVQMNFSKDLRKELFDDSWSSLTKGSFDAIKCAIEKVQAKDKTNAKDEQNKEENPFKEVTLLDILNSASNNKDTKNEQNKKSDDDENIRFESIISFPNFLLQVNAARNSSSDNDSSLDDKNLIKNLKKIFESSEENAEKAKKFIFDLLKYRVLFDKYILKRDYGKNGEGQGEWSLMSWKSEKKNEYPVNTFEDDKYNTQIKVLQSCLRITYTSPLTMGWIHLLLRELYNKAEDCKIIDILEEYCKKKLSESKYLKESGFGFERIVFTYLDYLLYRDDYKKVISKSDSKWVFQFRNSIEHFQPRNQDEIDNSEQWSESLDDFGNLALIDVSGNSKFSNFPPKAKIDRKEIINRSLKLKIMKAIIEENNGEWTPELAKEHREEMFKILDNELKKTSKPTEN